MEELSEEVVNEEDIEEVENQDNEDLAEAIGSWPILSKYQSTRFQYQILTKGMFRSSGFRSLKLIANTCLGIHDMRKLLQSKRRAPKGQDLKHHLQVLEFLRFQRYGLQKTFWKRTRKDAASFIAAANRHGNRVRNQLIQNERSWIKSRHIPSTHQGKSAMLHQLIDDEGTKLALREYLAGAGEAITGQSVAYAISSYWQTGILPFEEKSEVKNPPQPYSSETKAELAILAEDRQEVQDTLSTQTAVLLGARTPHKDLQGKVTLP